MRRFAEARNSPVAPPDLAGIPSPRIGFHGTLTGDKLDVPLVAELARRRSDWSFVLVGPEKDRAVRACAGDARKRALPRPAQRSGAPCLPLRLRRRPDPVPAHGFYRTAAEGVRSAGGRRSRRRDRHSRARGRARRLGGRVGSRSGRGGDRSHPRRRTGAGAARVARGLQLGVESATPVGATRSRLVKSRLDGGGR